MAMCCRGHPPHLRRGPSRRPQRGHRGPQHQLCAGLGVDVRHVHGLRGWWKEVKTGVGYPRPCPAAGGGGGGLHWPGHWRWGWGKGHAAGRLHRLEPKMIIIIKTQIWLGLQCIFTSPPKNKNKNFFYATFNAPQNYIYAHINLRVEFFGASKWVETTPTFF